MIFSLGPLLQRIQELLFISLKAFFSMSIIKLSFFQNVGQQSSQKKDGYVSV